MADLPALSYRVGTYATFLTRMLSSLDRQVIPDGPNQGAAPLRGVNTGSADDFVVALLRGWATVGDVLTFYQERIANECYLGSATEPRSVLELAHGIGYRPNPGVAASTYLALTVAETPGSPERVTVPPGTPVQSVPTQSGQLPQTFETSHEIEARASWNRLRPYIPQMMLRQSISSRTSRLRLRGLSTALNPGDPILIIGDKVERDEEGVPWYLRTLRTVEPNPEKGYTLVTWESVPAHGRAVEPLTNPRVFTLRRRLTLFGHDAPNWEGVPENIKLKYSARRGGLQLSLDQGSSWQPLDTNLLEQPIRALVINAAGVVFAGLAESGVFRSDNRGATWEPVNSGLTNLDINTLQVDERGYLFAGTANGVFRSADNGNQWEGIRGEFRIRRLPLLSPLDTELPATATRALLTLSEPDDQRTFLFAGTDRGIFRWVSDSTGWQPVNRGLPNRDDDSGEASVVVFALAVDPQSEDLFAGTDYGVFRSTNRGGKWRPINNGLPGFDSDNRLTSTRVRALTTLVDAASSQTCLFAGTGRGVFRSADGYNNWEAVNSGLPGGTSENGGGAIRISSLATCTPPQSQRTFLIAGTDQGVFRSDDLGASWTEVATDLLDKSVKALAPGPQGELAIATPVTGFAESDWPDFHIVGNQLDLDLSQPGIIRGSWIVLRQQRQEDPPLMRLLQATSVVTVPREDYGLSGMVTRVMVEPDGDLSAFDLRRTEVLALSQRLELFSELVPDIEPLAGNVLKLEGLVQDLEPGQAISITGNSMKVRVGDLGGVFRLEGDAWESMDLANQDIRALAINREGDIFAGTRNGGVFLYPAVSQRWSPRNTQLTTLDIRAIVLNSWGWVFAGTNRGGVFRSSDNGDYWTPVNTGMTCMEVRALAVNSSDWIFAGTREGVFRSSDDGSSWVSASAGLVTPNVTALAIDRSGHLYVGTRGGGVFRSVDDGESWVSIDAGLTNRDVRALAVDSEGNILAGTAGGGVFFLRPGAAHWTSMNDFLSFKDVRALAVGSGGEILAGTRGGGVFKCQGVQKGWEHLETGLSNDVRALASAGRRDLVIAPGHEQNLIVAGARNVSILTSADGLESLHLQQARLFGVSSQSAADLDQGAIPAQIIARFEDLTAPLSKDAMITVREEGASWLIEDPTGDVYPVRNERGSINVYRLPALLKLASAPVISEENPQMMRYELMDQSGFTGLVTAKTKELTFVPGSTGEGRVSEVARIQGSQVVADEGYTTLALSGHLRHVYDPRTVTVSANVAHATHGKTVEQDVLGSGKGDKAYQSFALSHLPLTYVADDTPTGSRSTLQVRVVSEPQQGILPGVPMIRTSLEEGVPWEEASSLIDSDEDDRHYITRVDEEGRTRIVFGDGKRAARLPTGTENVVATYRYGIGSEGEVAANSLTLLQRQPLGITSVTNPVPAAGAADPEPMDTARVKAPVAVRALGRIVSMKDYEDFIYGLPGVGKVQVKSLWNGQTRLAHGTVAGVDGAPVERGSTLYGYIVQAVQANRASPHHKVEINPADILHFNVSATVYVNPRFQRESVATAVADVLTRTFSFDNREFGEGVAASDVTSLIQRVPGVQHVDLKAFYTLGFSAGLQPYLSAYTATWGWVNNVALPAQLMLVNAKDGINLVFDTAV